MNKYLKVLYGFGAILFTLFGTLFFTVKKESLTAIMFAQLIPMAATMLYQAIRGLHYDG